MLVNVAIEINNANLDQPFSYLVDFDMQKNIKVGTKVIVPFGNRDIEGFVLSISSEYDKNQEYKEVKYVTNEFLNEEQLMIIKFLRDHNAATMIECINTILPPAFRASIKNNDKIKYVKCLRVLQNDVSTIAEDALIKHLIDNENTTLKEANNLFGNYLVNKLRKLKKIETYEIEDYRISVQINEINYYENLTTMQKNIVDNINMSNNMIHLIHGKTGSGKTVCYIELIKECISNGKEVLLLVPEVSLTTQLINIISSHFKDDIAVFHSKLSKNERYDQFRKIVDKKVKIAIGTRSSVFLPFTNLGLIVIDEEHDDSYVQEGRVCYSTKEIAALRAKRHGAKIVLGSATPDISTYYNALEGKIEKHVLDYSYSKSNVENIVVDMKSNFDWIISKTLEQSILDVINSTSQFILLLNRRGYANYLVCNKCGQALKCPNCDVTLNLHNNMLLKCHQCNYKAYNNLCECGSTDFDECGYGLQKVEEVLYEKFPSIKVARVDTDILDKSMKVSKIFSDFNNQIYNGLIGTQILSKGLNFTNVNLVAILDADYLLNINSYKASEKTFQYITQSLGRNARGDFKDCINIIQTYDTNHYAFTTAIDNNYEAFYKNEIAFRKEFNYPPFTKYTKILGTSSDLSLLVKYMNQIYSECKKNKINATKPQFANIERVNMQYRIQILVKHSQFSIFFDIINKIRIYNKEKNLNIIINNYPINF